MVLLQFIKQRNEPPGRVPTILSKSTEENIATQRILPQVIMYPLDEVLRTSTEDAGDDG